MPWQAGQLLLCKQLADSHECLDRCSLKVPHALLHCDIQSTLCIHAHSATTGRQTQTSRTKALNTCISR